MKAAKTSTKHPYAAIEHRVIDSPAYADLTFSSRALLILITRQLTKDNNGHLMATHSYLQRFGFNSEPTISRAIKELISHGMIYRSRSGGYQQGAAQYAVTWLSITNRKGLFLDGFLPCAWREWIPEEKKLPPSQLKDTSFKNDMRTSSLASKSEAGRGIKFEDTEYVPIGGDLSTHSEQSKSARATASIHRLAQVAGGRMQPIKHYA